MPISLNLQGPWLRWNDANISTAECLRVNGCSSTCLCPYDTYDRRFSNPSVHDPLCRFIYIVALEKSPGTLAVNRCIKTLTGDTSWKGPVVAFTQDACGGYKDISTSAFNRVLDEFCSVRGVRINTDLLVKEYDAPRFEEVTIKSYDTRDESFDWNRVLDPQKATPLTLDTGIVLKANPETRSRYRNRSPFGEKSIAKLLSIPCEISSHTFGDYNQRRCVGNVILMRKDKKPLTVNSTWKYSAIGFNTVSVRDSKRQG
jgi:hypothetical protein